MSRDHGGMGNAYVQDEEYVQVRHRLLPSTILRSGQDMPGVGSLLTHLMYLPLCVMQALLSNSDDESGGSRRESYEEEGQAGDAGVPGENDLAGPLLRRGASGVQRQSTERSSR